MHWHQQSQPKGYLGISSHSVLNFPKHLAGSWRAASGTSSQRPWQLGQRPTILRQSACMPARDCLPGCPASVPVLRLCLCFCVLCSLQCLQASERTFVTVCVLCECALRASVCILSVYPFPPSSSVPQCLPLSIPTSPPQPSAISNHCLLCPLNALPQDINHVCQCIQKMNALMISILILPRRCSVHGSCFPALLGPVLSQQLSQWRTCQAGTK